MHNKIILVLLLASCNLFAISSCKKSGAAALPKETQNGANTFGCLINGAVFIPHDVYSLSIIPGLISGYSTTTKKFSIFASEPPNGNANELQRSVYIEIINPHIGGNNFDINYINYAQITFDQSFQLEKVFQTSDSLPGIVNIIRLDTSSKIISGTFSFSAAQRDSSNNLIQVSDGRFDVTYK
ncbi:MAG: hypothetical protein ABIY62_09445 [Ginsengibacter sp.]